MAADMQDARFGELGMAPVGADDKSASPPARTRAGAVWSAINGGSAVVIPFLVFVLFARMATPGQIAPVIGAISLVEIMKVMGPQGVYDILIGFDETDERYQQTASALFLLFGASITVLYSAVELLLYANNILFNSWILSFLGLKIFFDYIVLQPQAVLARRMEFRRLGSRAFVAGTLSGLCGLAIAYCFNQFVVGIVLYYVAQSAFTYLMTVIGTGSARAPVIDIAAMTEMIGENVRASGVRFISVAFNYLDQLLMAAVILPARLGLYNLGKRIEGVGAAMVGSFGQTLFQPIFATADRAHRATHLARGIAAMTLVCGVPLVVLALNAHLAVPFVFGSQWAPAVPTVQLLALAGFARAIGGVAGALLTVSGRNALLLRINAISMSLSVVMILVLAQIGVNAVALGVLLRNALFAWVEFRASNDARGRLMAIFARSCFLPLAAAGAASWLAAAAVGAMWGSLSPLSIFAQLAAAGLAGAGAGALLLYPEI